MAYVDHAFSISDEDMMMEGSHADNNGGPIKEIALAVALLVFGALGIVVGIFMAMNKVGGDRAHGLFFAILGGVLFIPGFYYTRIAYYAYKGYKGYLLIQLLSEAIHCPQRYWVAPGLASPTRGSVEPSKCEIQACLLCWSRPEFSCKTRLIGAMEK